ncbi:cation:proton antiporter [Hymenobacter sp. BT175]|uniref:cation:proton antiporter domain-containing protein n=1 Tax=Hymenobacter translucens TaxID=2886507 RepID=UPI001D0E43A4|nr:cation:proton antiporter [Hymenobacter translucens]MCC2546452.1 cation:proton antiporter [Hymenobacter translucens]
MLFFFLSIAVVVSYLFDIVAQATKVPSGLMLLITGIALKQAAGYAGFDLQLPLVTLQLLGIVGLIMIVLEESLNLKIQPGKGPLIRRAFAAASVMLLGQAFAIAGLLQWYLNPGVSFQTCLLNAVPLAVVSSAVVVPSVATLGGEKQEFIIYESTFSDILGIMLFNFVVQDNFAQGISALTFTRDLVAVLVVSVLATAILAFLLDRSRHHVKFILILAFMVLIYSLAKKLHLSSLLVVLVFGVIVLTGKEEQSRLANTKSGGAPGQPNCSRTDVLRCWPLHSCPSL